MVKITTLAVSVVPKAAAVRNSAPTEDKLTRLQKLAELQKTGVLSDQEVAQLKAEIMAS